MAPSDGMSKQGFYSLVYERAPQDRDSGAEVMVGSCSRSAGSGRGRIRLMPVGSREGPTPPSGDRERAPAALPGSADRSEAYPSVRFTPPLPT